MKKFVIGIIVFTLLIIAGGAFLVSKAPNKASLAKDENARLEIDHSQFNFGEVKLTSGILTHRYPIKNIGQTDLKIANLASSCACTKVYFKSGSGESPKASMKGMTKVSSWVGVLAPQETGEMVIDFDPNFHGINGIGKIARSLEFETNDPSHLRVEFNLSGEVTR